ncbi:MAG: polysaccharide deacetylase family protein [Bdellovibrio sp.]
MKRSLSFLVISSVWALAACSNGGSEQVYKEMKESLQANTQSQTITEWHLSEANPEKAFARWNEDLIAKKTTSKDVCEAMAGLSDEELPLFEEEIRKPVNAALVTECKDQLISRLEDHWTSERANLTVNVDNFAEELADTGFKFANNVQYRDTSNGYYAVAGDVGPKQVVLTFDDGPSEAHTPSILATLKRVNAKAIFFEMGKNVKAHPDMVRLVAKDGHSLGGHSMTHSCLGNRTICKNNNGGHLFTTSEAVAEITGSLNAIKKAAGWVDPFFRFPYGESSPALKQYLRGAGIGEFFWSIDSEDWKNKSPQKLIDDVMVQLKARGKGVILFHDIQRKTAEALPEILRQLYKNGYQPVLLKPKNGVMTQTTVAELSATVSEKDSMGELIESLQANEQGSVGK